MDVPRPGDGRSERVFEGAHELRSIRTRRSLLPPPRAGAKDPRWEASWRHLFEVYAPALCAYAAALLRSAGERPTPEDAADVVQDYLTACLEKGWLQRDGPEIRSFRGYLKVQLRRFTWSWVRERQAQKRRPPKPPSATALELEAAPSDDLDAVLDAALLEAAVARCLEQLRAGNAAYGEIIADLLRTDGSGSADLAARLGREPRDLAVLRHRARHRFAALLSDELRSTVRDAEAFADLLAQLEPHLP